MTADCSTETLLARIAEALERLAPPPAARRILPRPTLSSGTRRRSILHPVAKVNRVDIALLRGVDRVRDHSGRQYRAFRARAAANNALLWGARGMGKSSLVKAAHADINAGSQARPDRPLKLIEIHREDIDSLPALMGLLRDSPHRFIVFCDDLSFDGGDASYKSLKAALEGGIEGRPANVLFYATSNRRHLLPRDMMDNERSTRDQSRRGGRRKSLAVRPLRPLARLPQMQPGRLSRDGLRLCRAFRLEAPAETDRRAEALEWAMTRGSRSGRAAWQFIQDLAGRLGRSST